MAAKLWALHVFVFVLGNPSASDDKGLTWTTDKATAAQRAKGDFVSNTRCIHTVVRSSHKRGFRGLPVAWVHCEDLRCAHDITLPVCYTLSLLKNESWSTLKIEIFPLGLFQVDCHRLHPQNPGVGEVADGKAVRSSGLSSSSIEETGRKDPVSIGCQLKR